jgi:ADP-ribosylglycohydrolase
MPHVLLMLFVLLDQLRNADQKTSKETNIKLSDWKEYFEYLNNNVKDHIDTMIENSLNEVENTPIFNELVFHI